MEQTGGVPIKRTEPICIATALAAYRYKDALGRVGLDVVLVE